jgi:UDP-N-acetylmuramate dehydrogenase
MVPAPDLRPLKAALEASLGPGRVEENVTLAPFTTFRIGGPADLLFRARTTEDLVTALLVAREAEASTFLLGRGANILVADAGFRGLVVKCETEVFRFKDDRRLEAQAGALVFPDLTNATVARGLGGLHHFVGIPSTVGGAMWQNLHFLSPDRARTVFLEEVVESAEILSAEGTRLEVPQEYFRFGYDYSILHERADTVLSVTFLLKPQDQEDLREVVRGNLRWRDERHPDLWLYPSAGSVFKKVDGIGAGRLIDECGLKGHVHGNAQIYHRHANIVVNLGGATAAHVLALIELARETVLRRTGNELVPEISMVGDFG